MTAREGVKVRNPFGSSRSMAARIALDFGSPSNEMG